MLVAFTNVLRRQIRIATLGVLALLLGAASLLAAPALAQARINALAVAPGGSNSVSDAQAFAPALRSAAAISTPVKRLTAAKVGVPAGTKLKKHYGDLTITKAGTVVNRMDIHGNVFVKARNVRITKSIIRGGSSKYKVGMITAKGQRGLVVEDTDITAARPSVRMDGVLGDNFTLRRVHIRGGVDNVQIHGDNVRIESSLLEKMNYYAHDPAQRNGPSHNDSIQILGGRNIVIVGTTALAGRLNFALLGGAEWDHITLWATNNYFDGGHCNVKLQTRKGKTQRATVSGNTFGPNIKVKSCPLVATKAVKLSASRNVAEVSGRAIVPLRI